MRSVTSLTDTLLIYPLNPSNAACTRLPTQVVSAKEMEYSVTEVLGTYIGLGRYKIRFKNVEMV